MITFTWDPAACIAPFGLNDKQGGYLLLDPRVRGLLVERAICSLPGWDNSPGREAAFDAIAPDGRRFEVRSFNKRLSFTPSSMRGAGRHFDEAAWLEWLSGVDGVLVADMKEFPTVEVYLVPSHTLRLWFTQGRLGKNASVGRTAALDLLMDLWRNSWPT